MSSEFLVPSELEEFRATLQSLFAELGISKPVERTIDRAAWKRVCDSGAFLAAIPEAHGGLDFGLRGASIVVEEAARNLVPLPIAETLLFGVSPLLAPEQLPTAYLTIVEGVGEGRTIVTGAVDGLRNMAALSVSEDGIISGSCPAIPYGSFADQVILPILSKSDRVALAVIDQNALTTAGATAPCEVLDLSRPFDSITFSNFPAPIIEVNETGSWVKFFHNASAVLGAAELLGLGNHAMSLIVDYAKTRKQFGKPIGSFQAVQHKLADRALQLAQLDALVRFAAWCGDTGDSQFHQSSAASIGLAIRTVPDLIEEVLQLHGGIGFTFEYPLHLYLRRAKSVSVLSGGDVFWLSQVALSDLMRSADSEKNNPA